MRYIAAAIILCVSGSAGAETTAKTSSYDRNPRSASLKTLVAATIARGTAWTVDDARSKNLGYESPPLAREFVLDDESSTTQLASMVTFNSDGKTLLDILISSTTATEFTGDQPTAIDGYTFRSDLSGRLISGIRAHGKVGAVVHDKLDPTETDTMTLFNKLLKSARTHPTLTKKK